MTSDTHYCYSPDANEANEAMLDRINATVPKPFTLVHAGDMGNHERWHRDAYLQLLRKKFPDQDIGVVLGNHDHWSWTKAPHFRVKDIIDENERFANDNSVHYLPNNPIEKDGVYICGFNGWYDNIYATQETAIPHLGDPIDGRKWLSRFAYEEFGKRLKDLRSAKERGLKTVLVTHMGFVEAGSANDWKRQMGDPRANHIYYGANPYWEDKLDDVDYLFYGHSHVRYDALAKNGKTRVVNAGSHYENPQFVVLEV